MISDKISFKKLILATIFFVALGLAAYFAIPKNPSPQPTPTPTSTPMITPAPTPTVNITDWKTYKNDKYGFEFNYPQNWNVKEIEGNNYKLLISSSIARNDLPENGGSVIVSIENITLDNFISKYNLENKQFCEKGITKKEDFMMLGNYKATKLTACTAMGLDLNYIFSSRQNQSYIIEYQDYDPIHKQILATFEFIK